VRQLMDIDIDVLPTFKPTDHFNIVPASMVQNQELKQHIVGVYFQHIPIDSITKLSAIPYKEAEQFGYNKIDFLHLTLLKYFDSKEDIKILLKCSPDWSMLQDQTIVNKLFHIHNHFETVRLIKPLNTQELADVIALIRPNKKHLISTYRLNTPVIRKELYRKVEGMYFKKSHSVAYAKNIELQMLLIGGGVM